MVQYQYLTMMKFLVVILLSRIKLSKVRRKNFIEENIGKIIIYCEGMTEKIYFDYFVDIIEKDKYDDIKIEIENAEGNAKRVYKFAKKHLENEENIRKYINYKKYLVFDCDSPDNIQGLIKEICDSCNEFHLLITNNLFEVWLLMHFEEIEHRISKKDIFLHVNSHLKCKYKKANKGVIREIIRKGDVNFAIENAMKLEDKYIKEGKNLRNNINDMNPYTNVYKLVEQLVGKITKE